VEDQIQNKIVFIYYEKLGIEVDEEIVDAGVGYTSGFYKITEPFVVDGKQNPAVVFIQAAPKFGENKGLAMGLVEDNIYHLNWYGYAREYPPATDEALVEYTSQLRYPDMADVLRKATRISPLYPYRDICSRRIRCDKCKNWPRNYLLIGDSMANYTPTYAQGMTFAALSADTLDKILSKSCNNVAKEYITQVSPILEGCWNAAVGEDLSVEGVKTNTATPPGAKFVSAYLGLVIKLMCDNKLPAVRQTVLRVINMVDPPYWVLSPHVSLRVLGLYLTQKK